ncbi:FBP domain-containing protein [Arthrobacter citreus]|uniref:FBP domain-containing protein n=1 Tax=Arthrobacter TaxID=1663 RepID=UPI0012658996|nr:FBP domain-containing protein [Arthrobacter gandavensis]
MQPLTESAIRRSFINASRSETAALNLPQNFETLDWDQLDQLGWRDHKMPKRGYLLAPFEGSIVGVLLRAPDTAAPKNRRVMCALCQDVKSKDEVFLYVARRSGASGRNGNSVGTLIHADFICSQSVRAEVEPSPIHPDPEVVIKERIDGLQFRTEQFIRQVLAQ